MTDSTVLTICARAGSVGLPRKNTRMLAGQPLVTWTFDLADLVRQRRNVSVVVSSDDAEILSIARRYQAFEIVQRPEQLATSGASKMSAIVHAVEHWAAACGAYPGFVLDLDVTCPLRALDDVLHVETRIRSELASSIVTASPSRRSPYFNLVEYDPAGQVNVCKPPGKPFVSRQESPDCYELSGAVIAWKWAALRNDPRLLYPDTRLHLLPLVRTLDIDTFDDFEIIAALVRARQSAEDSEVT